MLSLLCIYHQSIKFCQGYFFHLGEKTVGAEDPKRMEKSVFNIQLNDNKTIVNLDLSKIKGLSADEIQTVVSAMIAPTESDEQIIEILST